MPGFVDLHCHWVAGIDDGVRTAADGRLLLDGLRSLGFSVVVATPHMRPGMFDNDKAALERAYRETLDALRGHPLPEVHLASEHFFDDVVYERIMRDAGLPYPGGKAVLVELPPLAMPARIDARLFDLRCKGLLPVLAHPERYRPVWRDSGCLDPLLDAGACLLLDVCSLVGKYGRAAQRAAEALLEEGAYAAACSDAHRPDDLETIARALDRLRTLVGAEDTRGLLCEGPAAILRGSVP